MNRLPLSKPKCHRRAQFRWVGGENAPKCPLSETLAALLLVAVCGGCTEGSEASARTTSSTLGQTAEVAVDLGALDPVADVAQWRLAPAGALEAEFHAGRYSLYPIQRESHPATDGEWPLCNGAVVVWPFPAAVGRQRLTGCSAGPEQFQRGDGVTEIRNLMGGCNGDHCCAVYSKLVPPATEPTIPELQCSSRFVLADQTFLISGLVGGGGFELPDANPRSLQVGHHSACLLTGAGHPLCFGFGPDHRPVADEVFESLVSTGSELACGLRADGTVRCWGPEAQGELAAPPGRYIEQCAGPFHWCGLTAEGQVRCLGEDLYGETDVPEGPTYGAVACNLESTCVAKVGGGVECYGRYADDVLRPPEGLEAWRVSVNVRHACALLKDGGVRCWGDYDLHRDAQGRWTPPLAEEGPPRPDLEPESGSGPSSPPW